MLLMIVLGHRTIPVIAVRAAALRLNLPGRPITCFDFTTPSVSAQVVGGPS